MTITDKLLELNNVKQDIKTAIEGKGVDMTGVPFTGYPDKIDSITTGPGMSYHDYAKMLFSMWGYGAQFTEAWTESQNSLEVLFEIPLILVAPNQSLGGKDLDLYVGADGTLTTFYNLVAGGEFPEKHAFIIGKSVIRYEGDISSGVGMPFPVYAFGSLLDDNIPAVTDTFLIADLTPLGMGLGIALAKIAGVIIPDNSITIRRGFENYEAGLIIPEMIEIVGEYAFEQFNFINSLRLQVPFIIGPNVKYIGAVAFAHLFQYDLPLNIPDSVEWMGNSAFSSMVDNSNYLVIPKNVSYLGGDIFLAYGAAILNNSAGSKPATVIMYPETPPPLLGYDPLPDCDIFVPDDAVSAYISAWSHLANYIKAISTLPYHHPES